ncbi:MAG TPA: SpoIIE family protein phosphatase [Longimicrobiales bacterium]|nr:SpoIIE family protein phosphatase [Longimicrobiales bacterium]
MRTSTLAELMPLPSAVVAVLDAFREAHPGAELRLWGGRGASRVCLYPDSQAGAQEWPSRATRPIVMSDGPDMELELRCVNGTGLPEHGFLAHTLAQLLHNEQEARSAARELTERYEEINLLYFISEILASVLSVPDAATRILTEVADVLGARRATLWVFNPDDQRLHTAASVGEEGIRGPIHMDEKDSATAWVFRERQALNLERGALLPTVPRLEPRPTDMEAFLSVPINYTPPDGTTRTVGVITLVGRRANIRFSAGDARLLSAIASQIGAALETQRLVQDSLRQERIVREMELAHDLQLKLLPDPAAFDGPPEVAARCHPADSVGGDFYHLFRLPGDRFGIMIGDVSSHGFSAALIMALTMSAVAIYAQESGPPAEVLRHVHRALIKELESTEMYLTLFYGVLDPNAGHLVYANAGHPHAFHIDTSGRRRRLGATAPPLGIAPPDAYGEDIVTWGGGGNLVCLFTDGLTDAYPDRGSGPGEASMIEDVVAMRDQPLERILDHVFSATADADVDIPADDRTALIVRG